jgi:mannosyl-3-phosphoglycerate phosphatase
MKKIIVFSDLDGTLLDSRTYSFEPAWRALLLLKEKKIPLVICSSKTRAEIEHWRVLLDNHDPFISENGGGIFIPRGYFDFPLSGEEKGDYTVIRLGEDYPRLRAAIKELREEGFPVKGFGDMSPEEVSSLTGLSVEESRMAKERQFDETFIFSGENQEALFKAIEERGFRHTRGRFFHLMGASDKGKAASILIGLYRKSFGPLSTIAIGDAPNDVPMLLAVDYPVLVASPFGTYDLRIDLPGLIKAPGPGPYGWRDAIIEIINKHFS